jgi:HlyD family secretion protein
MQAACEAAAAGAERGVAAEALARIEVRKHRLLAPFTGVIARLSVEVGEWTTPSPPGLPIPPVVDFIDTSSLYVSAPMDEVDSARIRAGQRARITVDSHPGRAFAGRVVRVASYVLDVEAQNRTLDVDAELDDPDVGTTLLPGTSADVEVILDVREDVARIPTAALLEGGKVLVVEGDRLAERAVSTGVRNWDFTEVLSGVAPGESVVASLDRPEIQAGLRVRVVSEEK